MQVYTQTQYVNSCRDINRKTKQSQTDRKANKHRWNRTIHTAPGPNGQKQTKMATTHNRDKVKQPVRVVEPKHNGMW